MAVTVEVRGARELRAALKRCGDDLQDLADAHAAAAAYVAGVAASRAPHVSGRLAGSVRGNKAKTQAVIRAGGAAVPYAGPIHWGWPRRNIAPNPFIANAAHDTESTWTETYAAAVQRLVDKVGSSTPNG